jgi:hypothetical protein
MNFTRFTSLVVLSVGATFAYAQTSSPQTLRDAGATPQYAGVPATALSASEAQQAKNAAQGHRQTTSSQALPGVTSVTNFSGSFNFNGTQYNYWMMGTDPKAEGTTTINAKIIPVVIDLLAENGKVYKSVDPQPFIAPLLNSPNFQGALYSSSNGQPTQLGDAIQRAEFWNGINQDWHVNFAPTVLAAKHMQIPYKQWSTLGNVELGLQRGQLFIDKAGNVVTFADSNYFSNALFNLMVDEIVSGNVSPQDYAQFLFPNTYLYVKEFKNLCCTLGFHTYAFDSSSSPVPVWVYHYASWIDPGLFGASFVDVTGWSHETSEAMNDPFLNNIVPTWLAPNGLCQNNMETGDVIEGLPNAAYPITMNGFTYHPQNEALLPWFEGQTPSDAIGNSYSYPDKTVLKKSPAGTC